MPLFEVAIVEVPTKDEIEKGAIEKLVFGPKPILARDAKAASIKVTLGDERPEKVDADRAQVLVRPFA